MGKTEWLMSTRREGAEAQVGKALEGCCAALGDGYKDAEERTARDREEEFEVLKRTGYLYKTSEKRWKEGI